MMPDDRLDELMGRALREVDPPPPVPRDELWARIQAERASRRSAVLELRRDRRRPLGAWALALAATLLVGIGLGRLTQDEVSAPLPVASAGVESAAPVAMPYRLAATQHMQRTETLLSALAVEGQGRTATDMTSWARELLTDTRLLLSSPAAEDADTRRLLEDLELVLTQIAGIPAARAEQEVELIQNGINDSGMLLRLRAATTSRPFVGT